MKNLKYLILFTLSVSCNSTQLTRNDSNFDGSIKSQKNQFGDYTKLYLDLDKDGNFEPNGEVEIPEPFQGKQQWQREFYSEIKYPPSARQNGIQGIVVLNIAVNEIGMIEEIKVSKSISTDCDRSAKIAFEKSIVQGYNPLKIEGKSVSFKIDVPVGFWLD